MTEVNSLSFLNRLNTLESLALLQMSALENAKLTAVQENQVQAFSCTLSSKFKNNKFYIEDDKKKFNLDNKYSFCLRDSSKVYFFKSHLFVDQIGIYFTGDIEVHELKRRKHTRFDIPQEWNQSCIINQGAKKSPKIQANILNISWSGIRLEVGTSLLEFKLNQEIHFTIRIHRRAEFSMNGQIINIQKSKQFLAALGIQFVKTTPLLDSKIQNICDDLLRYNVLK